MLNSCASGFEMINPYKLVYNSINENQGVTLEFKYNLLSKKYAKKEFKKNISLLAIKISNQSRMNLTLGKSLLLTDSNGKQISIFKNEGISAILSQKLKS
tara:strand:- start:16 stop:315 length:300 start_codon:yes stop_codon:yes gene_type:complete